LFSKIDGILLDQNYSGCKIDTNKMVKIWLQIINEERILMVKIWLQIINEERIGFDYYK
jgi:hypothetical protein